MLIIVNEKPIQLTMVKAVPMDCTSQFWATIVEKRGESAITAIPQIISNVIKMGVELIIKNIGESRQQRPDMVNAKKAVFFMPNLREIKPPKIQETVPEAIMIKENNGICIVTL